MPSITVVLRATTAVFLFGMFGALIYFTPKSEAFTPLAVSTLCFFLLTGPLDWWESDNSILQNILVYSAMSIGILTAGIAIYKAAQAS